MAADLLRPTSLSMLAQLLRMAKWITHHRRRRRDGVPDLLDRRTFAADIIVIRLRGDLLVAPGPITKRSWLATAAPGP